MTVTVLPGRALRTVTDGPSEKTRARLLGAQPRSIDTQPTDTEPTTTQPIDIAEILRLLTEVL